jgi:hypothetical protein
MKLALPALLACAAASAQTAVPYAQYFFDEGSGTTATDTGSRGSVGNGTLYGNPTWVTDPEVGGALYFDGVDDYVTAPIGIPAGTTAYTIRAKIKFETRTQWATIVKNWGSVSVGAFHFGLYDNSGQLSNFIGTTPASAVFDPNLIPLGEWLDLSVSFDGDPGDSQLQRLYINGELVDDGVATGSADRIGTLMSFGVKLNDAQDGPANPNPGWFNGYLAEIEFYTVELLPASFALAEPILLASLATAGVTAFRAESDALQRRLAARRLAPANDLTREWFVDATHGRTQLDAGTDARTSGILAGAIHSLGANGYWGFNLGGDLAETEVRSGTTPEAAFAGGKFDGQGYRGALYAGVQLADKAVAIDLAIGYASLSGDLTRASEVAGTNVADIDAATFGAWLRVSGPSLTAGPVILAPFAQIEASRTELDGYIETGADDYMVVEDSEFDQVAYRLGLTARREWTHAEWFYHLGLEVAYVDQISDDPFDLTVSQPESGDPAALASVAVLPGHGVSIAPSLTFGPNANSNSAFTLGARFDQLSDGEAYSFQLGYRRKF